MSGYQENDLRFTAWHHRLQKKLLKQKDLLPKGSCLLVAVSGGQDSMALLKLLIDLKRIHEWNLHIWHGEHGWHDKSREISQELKNWCEKKHLNFYCDYAIRKETKTEKEARDWRYVNLGKTAEMISTSEKKVCKVLTAHTASDRAETLIMNIARGSDLLGLTTLREERILQENVKLIRPLLNFTRHDTKAICDELDLPIWIDPSNENLKFKRNKIRHQVLPILEELHSGCSIRISSLAERLSYQKEGQQELLKLALKGISNQKGLMRKKVILIPLNTRNNLIAQWLKDNQIQGITTNLVEEINHKIGKSKPPGSMDLKGGYKVIWTKESIHLLLSKDS